MEDRLETYLADSRTACKYGSTCYQKNPAHHTKYKHPPKNQQKDSKNEEKIVTGRKRSSSECAEDEVGGSTLPHAKLKKDDQACTEAQTSKQDQSPRKETLEILQKPEKNAPVKEGSTDKNRKDQNCREDSPEEDRSSEKSSLTNDRNSEDDSPEKDRSPEKDLQDTAGNEGSASNSSKTQVTDGTNEELSEEMASGVPSSDPKKIICDLFLVEMPDDFYKFYEFCTGAYPKDPSTALRLVDLTLVGPYDVLNGKITTNKQQDPEKYLRHWRYYYDPPEFQTVLKGNDRDGLHYGYWRDSPEEKPVFVAANSANKDCTISPVAPNIFGAVNTHIEERLKKANPFEKGPIVKLSKQLKSFSKENGLELEKENKAMRDRSRKVVTKTFHRAGIVVPYNTKTQLGYRDLAATDSQIKKILNEINAAESDGDRIKAMSKIEEIVRLAVIAADECDFGTCLELGHDLFSSGVRYVQRISQQMLGSAYNLLNRQKFFKIMQAHFKDRKKGCDLSVL